MSANPLLIAYSQLVSHEALDAAHVSVDRDRQGGETVNIVCDWVEAPGLSYVLALARELELEVVATAKGLRLAEHSDEFSARVRGVKERLEEARQAEENDDE